MCVKKREGLLSGRLRQEMGELIFIKVSLCHLQTEFLMKIQFPLGTTAVVSYSFINMCLINKCINSPFSITAKFPEWH
jgi:hypothetical protein